MSTNLTRFELQLPIFADGTSQQQAVNTFLLNINTLCDIIISDAYVNKVGGALVYSQIVYGLITAAQQATALGYLNTLNAALGTSVLCTVNAVTQEP